LIAPTVFDGAINGASFLAYVQQALVPTRGHCHSRHPVELQGRGCARGYRDRSAELGYPPPYSPDLNAIEQMFAKLKALLCKVAARSVEARWTASAISSTPSHPMSDYSRHSGYARSA
jgi:transposase